VELSYLEAGEGPPLVFLPGWSQTALEFKHQLSSLSDRWRCLVLDHRGHGASEKVDYGYKVQRLAVDLREFLDHLGVNEVAVVGHSMGASIIWAYYDLFGADRIGAAVFADEPVIIYMENDWDQKTLDETGAHLDASGIEAACRKMDSSEGPAFRGAFIGRMVTNRMPESERAWLIQQNLAMPGKLAATLFFNHVHQDWRDVIPRIRLPVLVIGGRVSTTAWQSQRWIHEQIPGSRLEIFEEAEGGGHFTFLEGPEKFNRVVAEFLTDNLRA